jgi:LDH2 family malate/lactate/ureidoglycolate dehydrogenase
MGLYIDRDAHATERVDHYAAEDLLVWTARVLTATGISPADAARTADVLVRTSLRGIDTHGISRIPMYAEKTLSGEVNAHAQHNSLVRDGVLYYDGDGGIGQAVAAAAVDAAVERAREAAVVPCVITRSGHLAAVGMFPLLAAEAGMVALLCQETPPLMAPLGSPGPAIGNNPIAFACPMSGRPPLVFDMASSVVARGSVLEAASHGRPIPEGWAIGPDGAVTTDAVTALKGAMLPIAGHKGIGLAMMVQVLAGSLSGSESGASAATYGSQSSAGNVGAFLLVINPDRMIGWDAFTAHIDSWLAPYLKTVGPDARYPGERAGASEANRRVHGIPVTAMLAGELISIGERVGAPFDLIPR